MTCVSMTCNDSCCQGIVSVEMGRLDAAAHALQSCYATAGASDAMKGDAAMRFGELLDKVIDALELNAKPVMFKR